MKKTSVVKLRSELSAILDYVEKGKDVEIQRRNQPIARIIPVKTTGENKTKLGCGKGSVKFLGDVVSPGISDSDWQMHK